MVSSRALERRLLGVVIAWATLIAVNDALPYVGLRDDSCQTMFSSLEWGERWNNHFFVPQHALADLWAYVEVRDVEITPRPSEPRLRWIAEWLEAPDRRRNTEALRVAVAQLCAAEHHVALSARRTDLRAELVHYDDACHEPLLSAPLEWLPVRLFETDLPSEGP